jgi:hypothetical protein
MKKRDKIVLSSVMSMGCSSGFDGNWSLLESSISYDGQVYNYVFPYMYCESSEDGNWETCYAYAGLLEISGTQIKQHTILYVHGYDQVMVGINNYSDGTCTYYSNGNYNCMYVYTVGDEIVKVSSSRFKIVLDEYSGSELSLSCSMTLDQLDCGYEITGDAEFYYFVDFNARYARSSATVPQAKEAFGSSGIKEGADTAYGYYYDYEDYDWSDTGW